MELIISSKIIAVIKFLITVTFFVICLRLLER